MSSLSRALALPILLALATPPTAAAQNSVPQAAAPTAALPAPRDVPYPGTIGIEVDATDTARAIFKVRQTIPVVAGSRSLTLLYPLWRPGNHAPSGRPMQIGELAFMVDGKPVKWWRDPTALTAFHIELPEATSAVEVRMTYTGALTAAQGQRLALPHMIDLQWDRLSLYPAGHYTRQIRVRPSVRLPNGWQAASALDGASRTGDRIAYAETDYETMADSPLFAGRHFQRWDLGQGVRLNVMADAAGDLAASPAQIAAHRALVDEALALFGGRHFDHYDFLLALSDDFYSIGTEHQRSSENALAADMFRDWPGNEYDRDLLPHEFVHSWNGKYRRPAGLWTPDFQQPVQPELLWVYEGQTQFWGWVLAARSGLQGHAMVLGKIASAAAYPAAEPGRAWRSLVDTTYDPAIGYRVPKVFATLGRGTDYYDEAALIWLEVDQIIRAGTGRARGLDDFARNFFGLRDGDLGQRTYERRDLIAALSAVYPHDWAGFFAERIDRPGAPPPTSGIERSGYRLVYRPEPNPYDKARAGGSLSLAYSLGLGIAKDGTVESVVYDGPAFRANIVPGTKLVAVDGKTYGADQIKRAVSAAASTRAPITLLVERGGQVETVSIAYSGGLRWPWLERVVPGKGPTGLDRLLAPRRGDR